MIKPKDPRELAETILARSSCNVQVGAVLEDYYNIVSWGWNSMGPDGLGMHAEEHCILRANPLRRPRSVIYVASRRRRNNKPLLSRPCHDCQRLLLGCGIKRVYYHDGSGKWHYEVIQ